MNAKNVLHRWDEGQNRNVAGKNHNQLIFFKFLHELDVPGCHRLVQ